MLVVEINPRAGRQSQRIYIYFQHIFIDGQSPRINGNGCPVLHIPGIYPARTGRQQKVVHCDFISSGGSHNDFPSHRELVVNGRLRTGFVKEHQRVLAGVHHGRFHIRLRRGQRHIVQQREVVVPFAYRIAYGMHLYQLRGIPGDNAVARRRGGEPERYRLAKFSASVHKPDFAVAASMRFRGRPGSEYRHRNGLARLGSPIKFHPVGIDRASVFGQYGRGRVKHLRRVVRVHEHDIDGSGIHRGRRQERGHVGGTHATVIETVVALVAVELRYFLRFRIKHIEGIVAVAAVDILVLDAHRLHIDPLAENPAVRNHKGVVPFASGDAHLVDSGTANQRDRTVLDNRRGFVFMLFLEHGDIEGVVAKATGKRYGRLVVQHVEGVVTFTTDNGRCVFYAVAQVALGRLRRPENILGLHVAEICVGRPFRIEHLADRYRIVTGTSIDSDCRKRPVNGNLVVSGTGIHGEVFDTGLFATHVPEVHALDLGPAYRAVRVSLDFRQRCHHSQAEVRRANQEFVGIDGPVDGQGIGRVIFTRIHHVCIGSIAAPHHVHDVGIVAALAVHDVAAIPGNNRVGPATCIRQGFGIYFKISDKGIYGIAESERLRLAAIIDK